MTDERRIVRYITASICFGDNIGETRTYVRHAWEKLREFSKEGIRRSGIVRREANAAVTDDFRRNSLLDLPCIVGHKGCIIPVRVDVDETRRDHLVRHVDDRPPAVVVDDRADVIDSAVANVNVCGDRLAARTVAQQSACENHHLASDRTIFN